MIPIYSNTKYWRNLEIYTAYIKGYKVVDIADAYNISTTRVIQLVRNIAWYNTEAERKANSKMSFRFK